MRIALLHSFYSAAASSGENTVVRAQAEALAAAGHTVNIIGRHTDAEQAHVRGYPLRAAWRTVSSRGPNPGPVLARFNPDVVHVHNTVPNLGLQWLTGWGGPIVHTLHNFRPLCANGLLFRDGRLCTDCPDGAPWSAVEHACYRDSRVFTLPIATRNATGIAHNPLLRRADRLIVLSPFARDIYERYGLPSEKLTLLPNGIHDDFGPARAAPVDVRWLVLGRLSAEKGVLQLLQRWPAHHPLDIVGDGPLRQEVEAAAARLPDVRVLGHLPREQIVAGLPTYTGLVFPGLAPESALPLVIGEALGAGIPVVFATDHPQSAPLVEAKVAWTAPSTENAGVSLAAALARVVEGGTATRARARHWFEDHLAESAWVGGLEQVYRDAKELREYGR